MRERERERMVRADLDELHEEMDVLGVDFLAEVVDGLVHVLRQRVPLLPPDVVPLAPDPLHVLPRRLSRRRRRRRHRLHGGGARAEANYAMGVKTIDGEMVIWLGGNRGVCGRFARGDGFLGLLRRFY